MRPDKRLGSSREELQEHGAQAAREARHGELPGRGPLPFLYPDQSLEKAMRQHWEWPLLPVLNRANLERLEGVISLAEILRAYRAGGKS